MGGAFIAPGVGALDEGIGLGRGLNFDFAGAGVTATIVGTLVTVTIPGGGVGGNTLDQAYDQGGPGVGRTIVADAGAVQIFNDVVDATNTLELRRSLGTGAALDISDGVSTNARIFGDGDTVLGGTAMFATEKLRVINAGADILTLDDTVNSITFTSGATALVTGGLILSGGGILEVDIPTTVLTTSATAFVVADDIGPNVVLTIDTTAYTMTFTEFVNGTSLIFGNTGGGSAGIFTPGGTVFIGDGLTVDAIFVVQDSGGAQTMRVDTTTDSTFAAGNGHTITGLQSFIGGGSTNTIDADNSIIGAGESNVINAGISDAFIGTGSSNTVNNTYGGIVCGKGSTVSGDGGFIGGGASNTVSGANAVVPGGDNNTASGSTSFAAGMLATAGHDGAFVWADSTGIAFGSTGVNQFLIQAGGGVGINTDTPGAFALHVNGATKVTGKLTVTGAIDPTSILLSDPAAGTALFYESNNGVTAPVSGATTGRIRYNNTTGTWQLSTQAGAYASITTTANAFIQNGNSFGAGAVLGTNDAFSLSFETGGVTRATIPTTGEFLMVSLGTAALPAYSFTTDTNTGMFSSGADSINLTTGGVLRISLGTVNLVSTLASTWPLGTAAAPAYSFTGDTNTGLFSSAADTLDLSTGGTSRFTLTTTTLTSTVPIFVPVGTAAAPSYSITGDTNTGIFSSGADTLNFTTAGTERGRFTSAGAFQLVAGGSAAAPAIALAGDTNTGIAWTAADTLVLSTAGVARLTIDSTGKVTIPGVIDPTAVVLSGGTAIFFESNDGSTAPVSGAATGRIRYNNTTGTWQLSTQGGAYASISTAAASGWTDDGTIVRLTTSTDTVAIGVATMAGVEKVRVVHASGANTGIRIESDNAGAGTVRGLQIVGTSTGAGFRTDIELSGTYGSISGTGISWAPVISNAAALGSFKAFNCAPNVTGGSATTDLICYDISLTNSGTMRTGIGFRWAPFQFGVSWTTSYGIAIDNNFSPATTEIGGHFYGGTAALEVGDGSLGAYTVAGRWFSDSDMVLGGSAMSGTEKLRVVGDARIEGKLTVTGAIDPTSILLSDPAAGTALFYESNNGVTAPVSGATTGRIRYNNTTGTWQVSTQAGAYASIQTTVSGWTDDGTNVRLTTVTDTVSIGIAAPTGGAKFHVMGDLIRYTNAADTGGLDFSPSAASPIINTRLNTNTLLIERGTVIHSYFATAGFSAMGGPFDGIANPIGAVAALTGAQVDAVSAAPSVVAYLYHKHFSTDGTDGMGSSILMAARSTADIDVCRADAVLDTAAVGTATSSWRFLTRNAGGALTERTRITGPGALQMVSGGTAAAPAIALTGDTNTGIAWTAADTLVLSTAGVARLTIDSAGKVTIPGTLDPTSVLLSGGTALFYESNDGSTAPVSGATTGRIRFLSGTGWQVSSNGGAYTTLASGGITGSGANTQVVFWTGASTVSGDAQFTFDSTVDRLTVAIVQLGANATPAVGDLWFETPFLKYRTGGGTEEVVNAGSTQTISGQKTFTADQIFSNATRAIEIQTQIEFDNFGDPTSVGKLSRNAAELRFHNGAAVLTILTGGVAQTVTSTWTFNATGQSLICGDELQFTNAAANATAAGRLRRNGSFLTWFDAGVGVGQLLCTVSAQTISGVYTFSAAPVFTDGVKLVLNPDGTNAGLNVGQQAGDPSTLVNGDIWYNSSINQFRVRRNGISESISRSVLAWGAVTTAAGGSLVRYGVGTEALPATDSFTVRIEMPYAGTLRNLYVRRSTAPGVGATSTYAVRINGADSAITASIAGAAATTANDTTNTAAVVAGDLVEIRYTVGGIPIAGDTIASLELD